MSKCLAPFVAVAVLLFATSARASLLVYEGFNYSLGNNTAIAGQATNATGLTGSYQTGLTGTGAFSNYITAGLSFGSNFLSSTGGALQLSTGSSLTSSSVRTSIQLNAGNPTGTLWNSYLGRIDTRTGSNNDSTALVRISNDEAGTVAGRRFWNSMDGSNNLAPGTGYGLTQASGSPNTPIALTTTYLFLAKFTNVGSSLSVGTPGVATQWVFTQAGYNDWVTLGNSLESNLGTYATWTSSNSETTGTYTFANLAFQQFSSFGSGNNNLVSTVDELRWGTTLNSVAVPEPSTAAAFLGGLVTLALLRSKRRVGGR